MPSIAESILRRALLILFVAGAASAAAIELPKELPPHPRILVNADGLPGLQRRASGEAKQRVEALRRQADSFLKQAVKLPEKGGQWYHWYSCPKHGARLRTEGPTRHVCPVDSEVFSGYPYDDVVISGEHNRWAGAVRTLGLVYQITREEAYAAKAKEILLAYAEKYNSYPLHNTRGEPKVGGGKVGPQTLDESTWLITVVEGADCVWDTLSTEDQEKVKTGLLLPATKVIREHKMGIHNIQCWKNSAVGLTGLLLGDMTLVNEAINGESGYVQQMAKGVSADGPWYEGAWGYHFYTISALLHLTEGALHSGVNLYGPELRRMFAAPVEMAMPDRSLPAFNASHEVNLKSYAEAYFTAYARYGDPHFILIPARGDSDAALFHGIRVEGVPDMVLRNANFTNSGNAILASSAASRVSWLGLKYGPHGGGHGHPDKLNFVLYGLGQVLAPDPGTANYGVPIQAGWFRTTLAHNTLVVDEESQQPATGRCEAFISTARFSAIMAAAGEIAKDLSYCRTVARIGQGLFVFIDQVRSGSPRTLDLAYHNFGKLQAPADSQPFTPPNKPGYSYLRDTRSLKTSAGLNLEFVVGDGREVQWVMAGGPETTVISGTGVGRHTEDRVPLVIARRQASQTAYCWAVSVDLASTTTAHSEPVASADGQPLEPSRAAAVRVKSSEGNFVILSNPNARPVRVRDVSTSGKIVCFYDLPGGKLEVRESAD